MTNIYFFLIEKQLIKDLSTHLGRLFVPYQYAVCMCYIEHMDLILKLDNRVSELFNIAINDLFEVIYNLLYNN